MLFTIKFLTDYDSGLYSSIESKYRQYQRIHFEVEKKLMEKKMIQDLSSELNIFINKKFAEKKSSRTCALAWKRWNKLLEKRNFINENGGFETPIKALCTDVWTDVFEKKEIIPTPLRLIEVDTETVIPNMPFEAWITESNELLEPYLVLQGSYDEQTRYIGLGFEIIANKKAY